MNIIQQLYLIIWRFYVKLFLNFKKTRARPTKERY